MIMCGLTSVRVSDIMSRKVLILAEDSTLADTVSEMLEKDVGSAIIVDKNGRCIGIITERDFLRLFKEKVDPSQQVKEYMSRNPITVREDASVNEARNIMITHKIRHLPVIDYTGRVVGVLSYRDIFERIETLI